jgi:hypothetical protein
MTDSGGRVRSRLSAPLGEPSVPGGRAAGLRVYDGRRPLDHPPARSISLLRRPFGAESPGAQGALRLRPRPASPPPYGEPHGFSTLPIPVAQRTNRGASGRASSPPPLDSARPRAWTVPADRPFGCRRDGGERHDPLRANRAGKVEELISRASSGSAMSGWGCARGAVCLRWTGYDRAAPCERPPPARLRRSLAMPGSLSRGPATGLASIGREDS